VFKIELPRNRLPKIKTADSKDGKGDHDG
jgi:hypothetical protein